MKDYHLNSGLAQNIVDRTMKIIDCNINVMNSQGRIIGSGDQQRLGELHSGALLAISQGRIITINDEAIRHFYGVKPGINLPLHLNGEIIGAIGLTGDPALLDKYGMLVCMTAEMMLEQSQLMHILAQNTRLQEELVLNLIRGEQISSTLAEWAKRLSIDLNQPRIAIIVEIDNGQISVDMAMEKLQQLQILLSDNEKDHLIAVICLNQLVILKPALNHSGYWLPEEQRQQLQQMMEHIKARNRLNVRLAMGNYFPGAHGIAYSYRTACTTMYLGKDHLPKKRVYLYHDFILAVLLDGLREDWQAGEFSRPLTKLRLLDSNGLLIKTLNAWYTNNVHPGITAKSLFIHRNTLEYRLKRISEITGLNLDNFKDRILLYIALQLDNKPS